jgi:hypothetical protein
MFYALNAITQLPDHSITKLLHFFVCRVLAAGLAEFFELQTASRCLLVLGRRIVPILTITAL